MARFFPGAKASVSVIVIRPSRRSATRLRRPSATLPPPVSNALRRAAGFVGKNKVGLVLLDVEHEAMPFGRIGNLPVGFLAKLGGDRDIALLKDTEKRVLLPFRRLEAAVGFGA